MKLSAQDRSQTTTNEAVDGREGVAVGVLEIAKPATKEWIDRGNDVLDRVTPVTPGLGPDFIPQPHEALLAHPTLARLEPVTQKLKPTTLQPTVPNVGFVGMQFQAVRINPSPHASERSFRFLTCAA
ncbi:hypothetical protein LMG29542_08721 [Paraburkholderia humisilvae]|uniref:Uncharacterized protein n=1 Tax=Paraburkholderia humisilvae TaxID=627669 RepID=A0A6J5F962_9BURK|nr:hypothetical protein LMG29542_08721 [Paraburkholderia humisilvae]